MIKRKKMSSKIAILNFSFLLSLKRRENKCLSIKLGWLMEQRGKNYFHTPQAWYAMAPATSTDYWFPTFASRTFFSMGIFHCFAGTVYGEQWHRMNCDAPAGSATGAVLGTLIHCCRLHKLSRERRAFGCLSISNVDGAMRCIWMAFKMHAKSSIETSSCRRHDAMESQALNHLKAERLRKPHVMQDFRLSPNRTKFFST